MRGLIIKDLLFFRSSWKNLLVTFIGTLLLSYALGNFTLAICVVPLYLMTSGINTFQTDEFYNTMAYTLSYPLSRKQIALAKYIFTLIMLVISTFIGLLIYSLIHFIINPAWEGLNIDMIKYLLILELASVFISSIFYPIIYKFGCEKSRLVMMSAVMLLLGIGAILSLTFDIFDIIRLHLNSIFEFAMSYGGYILVAAAIIFFIVSYIISVKVYSKRDF